MTEPFERVGSPDGKVDVLMDERTATAYHEAGHVVAGYSLGRGFTRVSIGPQGDSLGHTAFRPLRNWADRLEDAGLASSYGGFVDANLRRAIEVEIMISLAGPFTEMEAGGFQVHEVGAGVDKLDPETANVLRTEYGGEWGDTVIGQGDLGEAFSLCCLVNDEHGTALAYLSWLEHRTKSLLRAPLFWPRVEALVDALLECESLSGHQARAVLAAVRLPAMPGSVFAKESQVGPGD